MTPNDPTRAQLPTRIVDATTAEPLSVRPRLRLLEPAGAGQRGRDQFVAEWPHFAETLAALKLDGVVEIVGTTNVSELVVSSERRADNLVVLGPVNGARYLNKFFEAINQRLPTGGYFIGRAHTAEQRKASFLRRHPRPVALTLYAADYVIHRVLPKLRVINRVYFVLARGRERVAAKSEILGRLVCCGFKICSVRDTDTGIEFAVQKEREPSYDARPSYGPIFRMRRIGLDGRVISVYKLRTMHPYAEYLQAYIHTVNDLDSSGKFRHDFRVTTAGRHLRRLWLDELPMLLNWLRGDVKLVGVRPLSEHYLSLYPDALAALRQRYKPGLVPPYYADLPKDFSEILRSEERYLECYEHHPLRTDALYLSKALYNIFIRRARSA